VLKLTQAAALALPLFVLATISAAQTSAPKPDYEHGPYSSGVLLAHALATGKIHPATNVEEEAGVRPALACSPAPCAFKPVQASKGPSPVNEDPIATNPKNAMQLITAGNDYNCAATLQGYYASNDSGATWTRTCGVALKSLIGFGDPVVAYDLNGVVYRGGINADNQSNPTFGYIVVSKSTNNGKTWGTPVKAVPNLNGNLADKPWMQIDTTATSPHKNTIYISATQFGNAGQSQISVTHSTDGGKTWTTKTVEPLQSAPTVDQFSDLAIATDGTVYVSFMRCPGNGPTKDCGSTKATMFVSKSTDGGNTWSTAVKATTAMLVADTCNAFYGCLPNTLERVSNIPAIAVDNSTAKTAGKLYLIDYTWTGKLMKVQVVSSTNKGMTWGAPVAVAPTTGAHDQFFPWVNVSSTGVVGASWLDRRNDPSNINYDAFGAGSKDGGKTYPNQKLSAKISNPNNDGFGGQFMGDYTGNSWAGGSLYVSWMDTSNGAIAQDLVGGLLP